MNCRASILCLLTCTLVAEWSYATENLRVQDPRNTWRYGQGTIESATLSVRPKSIYVEHELALTFSARGLGYTSKDTLEVVLSFDLPTGAIVHDAWLWIDSTYEHALIMDVWKASSIYEGIVKRRQDPAILYKRGDQSYELRVFPLVGDRTRLVRLLYSIPATWSATSRVAELPANILRLSKTPMPSLRTLVWLQPGWPLPVIPDNSGITFVSRDSLGAKIGEAVVPGGLMSGSLNVELPSSLVNGVYLRRFPQGSGGVYSLVFLPSQLFDISAKKKIAVVVDYDITKTTLTQDQILSAVKTSLLQSLAPGDSFNLLLSHVTTRRASDHWIAFSATGLDSIFKSLGSSPLGGFTNLITVLSDGIDFAKKNGNNGSILLVSDADQSGDYQTANQVLPSLMNLMNPPLRIDVVDYASLNLRYYYFNSRSYRGNEYLYLNLTRMTGGEFTSVAGGSSVGVLIAKSLVSMGGSFSSFDVYTSVQGGFCYSRIDISGSSGPQPISRPVMQTGWYAGLFPFIVQVAGMFQNTPFVRTVTIPNESVVDSDSSLVTMWEGNRIATWEASTQTNDVITAIIDESVRHRVLSKYTAFLVLEPRDTSRITIPTDTNPVVISVDEPRTTAGLSDSLLIAYPNPFNGRTIIRGRVPAYASQGYVRLEMYSVLGQRVRTFDPSTVVQSDGRFTIVWDGGDDRGGSLASGTYFFVMTTSQGRQSLKLLYLK